MKLLLILTAMMDSLLPRTIDSSSKQSYVPINTIGVVGSFGHVDQTTTYYILTQNTIFILATEPIDDIFGKIISFQGMLDKNTGDLQLNTWGIQEISNFEIKQQGTLVQPLNSKRVSPYFVIQGAYSDKSVAFSISSSNINFPVATATYSINAQYKVLKRTKKSISDGNIENIIQTDEIDTNSISLTINKINLRD